MIAKLEKNRQPVHREEDGELLGYVRLINGTKGTWQPETIFGYPLAGARPHSAAVSTVESGGLSSLLKAWEFKDQEDGEWYRCQITEAHEHQVRVTISDFGHSRAYGSVTIGDPSPTNFRCPEISINFPL